MSGKIYGIVTIDPITGKKHAMWGELGQSAMDAQLEADGQIGEAFVVVADLGPFKKLDDETVADLREKNRVRAEEAHAQDVETELQKMLDSEGKSS